MSRRDVLQRYSSVESKISCVSPVYLCVLESVFNFCGRIIVVTENRTCVPESLFFPNSIQLHPTKHASKPKYIRVGSIIIHPTYRFNLLRKMQIFTSESKTRTETPINFIIIPAGKKNCVYYSYLIE